MNLRVTDDMIYEPPSIAIKTKHAIWIYNQITKDIQCYGSVGCYGHSEEPTPDALWSYITDRDIKLYEWYNIEKNEALVKVLE